MGGILSAPSDLAGLSLAALCAVTAALFVSTTPALALGGKHIFSGSFGGAGTSTLSEPAGVAVNESSGDVYVVDKGNNRVEYFTASGGYLGQFNGSGLLLGEGSGVPHGVFPGQFSSPEAIAVNNACQRHTPELTEVTTPTCNEFDPSNGDVYVADTGHKVIDKFSASGAYLGQLTEADGAPFGGLFGVAVDQTGTVWVFQESGEIDSFSDAEVNGFLSVGWPYGTSPGFAVDSEDDLYVNRGAKVLAKLNSAGESLIEELGTEETSAAAADLLNR